MLSPLRCADRKPSLTYFHFNVDHQESDSCVDVEPTEVRGLQPSPEELSMPDSSPSEAGDSSLSAALHVEKMHRILLEE